MHRDTRGGEISENSNVGEENGQSRKNQKKKKGATLPGNLGEEGCNRTRPVVRKDSVGEKKESSGGGKMTVLR